MLSTGLLQFSVRLSKERKEFYGWPKFELSSLPTILAIVLPCVIADKLPARLIRQRNLMAAQQRVTRPGIAVDGGFSVT
jgi:hypothetical protein